MRHNAKSPLRKDGCPMQTPLAELELEQELEIAARELEFFE
jgi:hypothetical protein